MKTSGDALLSLIEELLDYSKIEAGKIDLEHRPFALPTLIENITELLPPRRHHHQRRSGAGILAVGQIQMPQLNGIETTKRIRALEAGEGGRQTPILALTANTLVEDRYACFEAGMDGFLIKPLDREKLTDAVAGLAASRHIAA